MLKTVHRSILKELAVSFLLTLLFLNSVLMMEKLVRLSRLLSGVGASLTDMAKIVILLQPQLLPLTIPMSLLLSTLLVYGRMNIDSEMVAMKAAGMSFTDISRPVAMLGILCFLFSAAVSFSLGPRSSVDLRNAITQIITVRSTLSVEEGTFNTSFKDIMIIVKGKKSDRVLEDIFIYDSRDQMKPRVLTAKTGEFFVQDGLTIGLLLTKGYINITKGEVATDLFFDRYKLTLSLDAESPTPKRAEFTPRELVGKAQEEESPKRKAALLLELHRRLSLPVVCLLLIVLGPPLSLIAGRSGRLGGLALGLLVFTLYYTLLIYGENLVMAGSLHHIAGAWAATVVLGVFALILFRRGSSS